MLSVIGYTGHPAQGTTVNLSPEGCQIISEDPVSLGSVLRLSITWGRTMHDLSAVVVHTHGKGFGVRFSKITDEQRAHLAFLLH